MKKQSINKQINKELPGSAFQKYRGWICMYFLKFNYLFSFYCDLIVTINYLYIPP